MNYVPACVAAFTLIELMLSVALGSMILFTAFAGFRVASQAVTAANRLSIENSLMRAGYFEAQRQVDYWTQYDDPDQPIAPTVGATAAQRHQTGTVVGGGTKRNGDIRGFPFTPAWKLSNTNIGSGRNWKVWPQSSNVPRFTSPVTSSGGAVINEIAPRPSYDDLALPSTIYVEDAWEKDTGWDSTYSWAAHDPRTWDRTNLKEKQPIEGVGVLKWGTNAQTGLPEIQKSEWAKPYFWDMAPPLWYGRYALFSQFNQSGWQNPSLVNTNSDPKVLLTPWNIIADPNVNSFLNYDWDPSPPPPALPPDPKDGTLKVTYDNYPREGMHPWLSRQKSALFGAYGYAALLEYMPPNSAYTVYSDYDKNVWSIGPGSGFPAIPAGNVYCGLDNVGIGQTSGGGGGFAYPENQGTFSTSIYTNTQGTAFGFFNPRAVASLVPYWKNLTNFNNVIFSNFRSEDADVGRDAYNGSVDWTAATLMRQSGFREPLMENKPVTWPFVQVSVARFIKNAHHIALSKVSVVSPLTGKETELMWGGIGSSLRGARQQRKGGDLVPLSVNGWAKWDNGTSSVNDKHMDNY